MTTICGRNKDGLFFLTRDGDIEITSVGFPDQGQKGLAHYEQQYVCAYSKEEFDEFGLNHTDRLFIRHCAAVFDIVKWVDEDEGKYTFKSLSCKKISDWQGERYIARLELSGMTLEYELGFMVELIEKMYSADKGTQ
jgi:hypothetical protein